MSNLKSMRRHTHTQDEVMCVSVWDCGWLYKSRLDAPAIIQPTPIERERPYSNFSMLKEEEEGGGGVVKTTSATAGERPGTYDDDDDDD